LIPPPVGPGGEQTVELRVFAELGVLFIEVIVIELRDREHVASACIANDPHTSQ
jgi:hypothetical protein